MELFNFLLSKSKTIILFGVIGLALGYFYVKKKGPLYESYMTFSMDEGASDGSGGLASIAAQFGIVGNSSNNIFSGDNIIEIIKSRRIIENVLLSVDTFNNKPQTMIDYLLKCRLKRSLFSKNKKSVYKFPAGIKKPQLSYTQDSMLYSVYKSISEKYLEASRPDKKLNIYMIKYQSEDEVFTKKFTDKILKATTELYIELKTKKGESTISALEQRVEGVRSNLSSSLSSKASFQDANINPALANAQVPIQKQQIKIQANGAAFQELNKNLEFARFQQLQNTPLLQVIDEADYPMEKVYSQYKYMSIGFILFSLIASAILLLLKKIKELRLHGSNKILENSVK